MAFSLNLFNPFSSFRARLVMVVGLIGLIVAVALSYGMRHFASEQVKQDRGSLLAELAAQMAGEMDKGIFERRREMQIVASLKMLAEAKIGAEEKRQLLETLQASYKNYAWIGFTDTEGNILTATHGLLEGKNVKARNWFIEGAKGPAVGDVHDAFLLAKLLPKPEHDFLPLRLLDVSTPITDNTGRWFGVLCGHLSWDWAFQVRNNLLEPLKAEHSLDVIIVNDDGQILLGTPELNELSEKLTLPSLDLAKLQHQGYIVETWPDGKAYLTGFYASRGFADFPGLGWTVLVRQNKDQAYAPVYRLQNTLFSISAGLGLLFGLSLWLAVSRLVKPMHAIAEAANKIRFGTATADSIPVVEGRDEIAVMSIALRDLLIELDDKNRELKLAAQVFRSSTEGVVITGPDQTILTINRAYSQITGYSEGEVVGKKPSVLSSGLHSKAFYQSMWRKIAETGAWQGEVVNRRKDGTIFPEWLNISTVYGERRQVEYYIGIFSDITERKQAEEKIRFLANHDVLTGLPNRLVFEEKVAEALRLAEFRQGEMAVLFVDLDRFKYINDSLGHPMGDRVLQEVAQRMQGCVSDKDTLARFGGDEFVIVLRELSKPSIAAQLAERLVKAVTPTIEIDGYQLHVSISIGISIYPQDGCEATVLVKNADAAMFHAKEFESNSYRFFTDELNQRVNERLRLENALHRALAGRELFLVYQPQFDLATQAIKGAEVLLRWNQSDMGSISPAVFIPIAEETGLIVAIGEWIIQQALRDFARLQPLVGESFSLGINISPVQIQLGDIVANIDAAIKQNGLQPTCRLALEIEITESAIVHNLDVAKRLIQQLRQRGISVAVDDFGTGYSNLSVLRQLEIDRVKIDQSFVRQLPYNENDKRLVKTIVGMAEGLGLDCIAEGIETLEQLQCLQTLGCPDGQGFLVAKPMPLEDLIAMLSPLAGEPGGCSEQ